MAAANPNSMSGAAEARAAQEIDLSDFATQVDDTYHALRAFNFLLEHVNEYVAGEISGTINYGISHLLRRQIDDLEEIKDTVFNLVGRVRQAEQATATAPVHGLPPDMVVLPTYYPGIERDLRAKAEARQVDLAEIARSTNLKEETVRRVLDRLLADPAPDDRPAVSNG